MATPQKSHVRLAYAAFLLAGIALTMIVVGALYVLTGEDPWDPLGDYPVQEVLSVEDGHVLVEGTKCNDSNGPVRVRGTFNWQRVSPRGFIVSLGEGVAVREVGCVTQTFDNTIPAEVLEVNKPGDVWRLLGTETPINGREGVPVTWQTENFELLETEE